MLGSDQEVVTQISNAGKVKVVGAVGRRFHYGVTDANDMVIAEVEDVDGFTITGDHAIFYRNRGVEAT
jgi:hypothetical protein